MEIGRADKLSTHEREYYVKKAIGLGITAFMLILFISFFIIANYTSLFERKIFEEIAEKYGYKLSYSNTYEVLASKNADQGNYIQLSDEENQIYILFRFDEDSVELVEIFDSVTNTKNLYAITTKVTDENRIRTEEEILVNIDKEFNPLNSTSVKGNANNIGGGYSILNIDSVMNQHRIEYMSNLLKTISESNKKVSENKSMTSEEVLSVKNWFNYSNSINYQLGILKAIVETEAEYDSSNQILYSGNDASSEVTIIGDVGDATDIDSLDETDIASSSEENSKKDENTIDKSLEGFISNREELVEEYGNTEFSTYTSLVLSNETNIRLDKDKEEDLSKPNGVIIGTCINKDSSISKMSATINLLIIISYLERTLLL